MVLSTAETIREILRTHEKRRHFAYIKVLCCSNTDSQFHKEWGARI